MASQSPSAVMRRPVVDIRSLTQHSRLDNEAVVRALCHSSYLGGYTALCRVLGRYKMFVDTRDIGLAPHLMLEGYWEMWVTEALIATLREGMVVADVGANVGYFTLLMADLVGSTGRVHAFEPNPFLVELLGKSLSVNGFWARVSLHQTALSNEDGRLMELFIPPGEPKNGHLIALTDQTSEDALTVGCSRMDSLLDWEGLDLAKVDVEGAEQLVWAGMKGLLDGGRLKTVFIEFAVGRYDDPASFLRDLLAPGFSLGLVDVGRGIVPASIEQVLSADPLEDIMLVLRR